MFLPKMFWNFTKIARTISELLPISTESKRASKKRVKVWKWASEEQNAFVRLKDALAIPYIYSYTRVC